MNTQASSPSTETRNCSAMRDLASGLFGQRINRQQDQSEAAEPVPA